jgi:hypothetical protein
MVGLGTVAIMGGFRGKMLGRHMRQVILVLVGFVIGADEYFFIRHYVFHNVDYIGRIPRLLGKLP